MKMILKLSLLVLIAMTTINSYAIDGDFLLNVKKAKPKQISFSVNEIQKATVTIYDKEHNEIYSEIVTGQGGISRIYSLDEFPDGDYYLEVKTDLKRVTHSIEITHDLPTLSRKSIASVDKRPLKIKKQTIAAVH